MFANLAELVKDNMQYTIISNIIWETYEKRLSRKDVFDMLKFNASNNLKRVLLFEGVKRPGTVIAIGDCYERALERSNSEEWLPENSSPRVPVRY